MALPVTATPSPPASYEAIFRTHFGVVVRWARWFGAPAGEAEDIAQLVFLALHRAIAAKRYSFDAPPRRWLRQTTFRTTRDHVLALGSFGSPTELEGELEPMDGRPDAERTAQAAQLANVLEEVLDGLPFDLRVVFVLHELEELTVPEIAAEVGIKLSTAGYRLRAARAEFQKALDRRNAAEEQRCGAALVLPLSADAIVRLTRAAPRPEVSPEMEARVWARIQKEIGLSPGSHQRSPKPREVKPRTPRARRTESLVLTGLAFVVGVVAGAMGLDLLRRPAPPPRPPRELAPILAVAALEDDDTMRASLPDPVYIPTASATPATPQAPPDREAQKEAERRCLQTADDLLTAPGKLDEGLAELERCEKRFPLTHFPAARERLRQHAVTGTR